MTPSGYKLQLEKHPATGTWRLIGTVAEGLFCHKPCTVSGGGKSEISKSLGDYILYGPIFVADLEKDLDLVQQLFDRDYAGRWRPGRGPDYSRAPQPAAAEPAAVAGQRDQAADALGRLHDGVQRLAGVVPDHIYPLVFLIKRYLPPEDPGKLAGTPRRRLDQRPAGPRAEGDGAPAGRELPARRAAVRAGLADVQAPAGLRRRR